MATTVLIGAQWGDEGKGKIIDVLSEDVDWVVRYQGGNNAGHTLEINQRRYVLHLIPSGIFHPQKKCVIGNGLVVDPFHLLKELDTVAQNGVDLNGRLLVSDRAHMVLPIHRQWDEFHETSATKKGQIGTTKRGIGPAYTDKASRTGLRMGDLLEPEFSEMAKSHIEKQNRRLQQVGLTPQPVAELTAQLVDVAAKLKPYIADTIYLLNQARQRGESILFEGAQGTMLDIDFGTYPYVTSSNATAGGACTGTGVPPNAIDQVIGVVKAYTTRVGEGPFPTELFDDAGEKLRQIGREVGATTGRPRRCGWFDAVIAQYAAMVNGIDRWAITKLDVMDQFEEIKICVAYECRGKRITAVPSSIKNLADCKPIYESWPGWKLSTRNIHRVEDLPLNARRYLHRIEEITGVPVGLVSVGPGRESTLRCEGLQSVQPLVKS